MLYIMYYIYVCVYNMFVYIINVINIIYNVLYVIYKYFDNCVWESWFQEFLAIS